MSAAHQHVPKVNVSLTFMVIKTSAQVEEQSMTNCVFKQKRENIIIALSKVWSFGSNHYFYRCFYIIRLVKYMCFRYCNSMHTSNHIVNVESFPFIPLGFFFCLMLSHVMQYVALLDNVTTKKASQDLYM